MPAKFGLQINQFTSADIEAESADEIVERFGGLVEAGAQHLIFGVRGVADTSRLERLASEVFPQLRG